MTDVLFFRLVYLHEDMNSRYSIVPGRPFCAMETAVTLSRLSPEHQGDNDRTMQ